MRIIITLECSRYVVNLGLLNCTFETRDLASNYASDLGAQLGIDVTEDCDEDLFVTKGYWKT